MKNFKLAKPVEYGGVLIQSFDYSDDLTPAQLREVDLTNITKVGELSKAIAGMTRQPIDLIESLSMEDWLALSQKAGELLGNSMIPTKSLPTLQS